VQRSASSNAHCVLVCSREPDAGRKRSQEVATTIKTEDRGSLTKIRRFESELRVQSGTFRPTDPFSIRLTSAFDVIPG